MNINRDNYEIFFIDYYDGTLNEAQEASLRTFLSLNPDLEKEFYAFGETEPETVSHETFGFKNSLKKHLHDIPEINHKNFDEFCIAHYEGDLNLAQTEQLVEYTKTSIAFQRDFYLYSKVFAKADNNIYFPNKAKLKQGKTLFLTPKVLAYAASVAILVSVGIGFILRHKPNNIDLPKNLSNTTNKSTPIEKKANIEHLPVLAIRENNKLTIKKPTKETIVPYTKPNNTTAVVTRSIDLSLAALQPKTVHIPNYLPKTIQKSNVQFSYLYHETQKPSLSVFKDRAMAKVQEEIIEKPKNGLSFWAIAEASVKGFNALTESNIMLSRETDHQGQYIGYKIVGNKFYHFKAVK